MSVLKRRRLESKANYLNYANEICDATVELLAYFEKYDDHARKLRFMKIYRDYFKKR